MLNYEQATNIIEIIKEDISLYNKNQEQARHAYTAIYNYLSHAGGHTLVPSELKAYTNTLSIFQNPNKLLTSIKEELPKCAYFDDKLLKQEIQTITLLWLREATIIPIKDIDLHIIINQCNSMH